MIPRVARKCVNPSGGGHDAARAVCLPLRIIVPLTSWQARFAPHPTKVFVAADSFTGLDVDSAADLMHVRSVSTERFHLRLGHLHESVLADVAAGIATAVGYDPGV